MKIKLPMTIILKETSSPLFKCSSLTMENKKKNKRQQMVKVKSTTDIPPRMQLDRGHSCRGRGAATSSSLFFSFVSYSRFKISVLSISLYRETCNSQILLCIYVTTFVFTISTYFLRNQKSVFFSEFWIVDNYN